MSVQKLRAAKLKDACEVAMRVPRAHDPEAKRFMRAQYEEAVQYAHEVLLALEGSYEQGRDDAVENAQVLRARADRAERRLAALERVLSEWTTKPLVLPEPPCRAELESASALAEELYRVLRDTV